MVLGPLNKKYDLKRVIVSTYQSVTGTGKAAVDQLNGEISGDDSIAKVYPYQIFKNALPHCDVFADDDYTKED
jgi:aspartate-semialdehyde dehydrogenase